MPFRVLKDFLNELSRRFGEETVASDGNVRGSILNDVIVASDGVTSVKAGFGNDVIVVGAGATTAPASPVVYDGGRGADTYIVSAADVGTDDIEECLIFDYANGGFSTTADGSVQEQIVLRGFDEPAGATVTVEADGLVRVTDGTKEAVFRVERPDGVPVSADIIEHSIVFADGGVTEGFEDQGKILIISEDLDPGEDAQVNGSRRSETILVDETASGVSAGGGDDVIIADRTEASGAGPLMLDGGLGADTYFLFVGGSESPDIEECLIFDLADGGVSARGTNDTAQIVGFGPDTLVSDQGDGVFLFEDPNAGCRKIAFEYSDGEGLSIDDLQVVLINASDFAFASADDFML